MQILDKMLSDLVLGQPTVVRNLAAYPLLSRNPVNSDYLTLDEALEQGGAMVSEVSEGGCVPELRFENCLNQKVLLLDGEELVGAKQNRILNLSILVAPGHTVTIPVSCVEHGRWAYTSRRFGSGKRKLYSTLKSKKMASVTRSMRDRDSYESDQAEIWYDIDHKSARMGAHSATGCMDAMYEAHAQALGEFRQQFGIASDQVGAVFLIDGEVAGLECLDSPVTYGKVKDKLVDAFALDAVETSAELAVVPPEAVVGTFLRKVAAAQITTHPAVDLGQDLRLTGELMVGGALVADGRILHLSAFNLPTTEQEFHQHGQTRQ